MFIYDLSRGLPVPPVPAARRRTAGVRARPDPEVINQTEFITGWRVLPFIDGRNITTKPSAQIDTLRLVRRSC
jgi:hypothetical protein